MKFFYLFFSLCIISSLKSQTEPVFSISFDDSLLSDEGEAPTNSNGVILQPGIFGMAAELQDGDVLQYPVASNISSAQGSLSLWIRPYWEPNGIFHRIFVFGENPRNFEIHHDEGANLAFAVNTWNADGQTIRVAFGDGMEFGSTTWQHLVYTWDETQISIYLNGELIGSTEVGYPIPTVTEEAFHIGSLNGEDAFDGLFDELAIYDQVLNEEEISSLYNSYFNNLPLANELSVINRFENDVTSSGISLVDWEGPIRNPALKYFIAGSEALEYPLTVILRAQMPEAYFNLPSTVSQGVATKSLVINNQAEMADFYMSVYMDEDGIGEVFDLELIYPVAGGLYSQIVNIHVVDQDYDRPLSYPVITDFSAALHPFFQNDTVKAIITEATEDWAYYIDGDELDNYPENNNWLFIRRIGETTDVQVFNQQAFDGFYLYVFGTDIIEPCICSTGSPSIEGENYLHTSNGNILPIPRMGGHELNVRGNFNETGYVLNRPYDNWTFHNYNGKTDLYSLAKHEIGHAMVYEYGLPTYNEFIEQNLITSPLLEHYYPGGVVLQDDAVLHLVNVMDPESLTMPYGGNLHQVPVGRDMFTKLDLLIMEAVGYPLRENEVTRPLSVELDGEPGQLNQVYEATLSGSGGVPVYRFSHIGGLLPEGLVFDGLNKISGIPQETGLFPIQMMVEDYSNNEDMATVELVIQILRQEAELIDVTIESQVGATALDPDNKKAFLTVSAGTDLTNLIPDLTVSPGAVISPDSGIAQDFTNPVSYTITSEDGEINSIWEVIVSPEATFSAALSEQIDYLNLYPNPTNDFLFMDIKLKDKQEVQFLLFDNQGQRVLQDSYILGQRSHRYDLRNYSSGVYYLYLLGKDSRLLAAEKILFSE